MTDEKKVIPRGPIETGYIDRLAGTWPEPREQLHIGGWYTTFQLVEKLGLARARRALDLCCGEGGTATWLSKTYGREVVGVDILESAIKTARKRAISECVDHLATFEVADVFDLPFPDDHFDVIYGQDPDGLAHRDRVEIFRECIRILQAGGKIGFQHWILQSGAPEEIIEIFDKASSIDYPYMTRLTEDAYVSDMKAAGFVNIEVEDMSEVYYRHTIAICDLVDKRGLELDKWNKLVMKLFDDGYPIGVRIVAEVK